MARVSTRLQILRPAAPAIHSDRGQRAVLGLHRALEFADLWKALQRMFETLVPHDTLVLSVNYLDWRREATTRRLTSAKSRVVDDKDSSRLVAEEGRTFFQPFLEAHPGIHCYKHTQVMADPSQIPQTRYYQRYMIPLGWAYSAHLLFWKDRNVETSFALRRRPDQGDFTGEEMDILEAVYPHIAVAFDRVREFEGERRRRRLLENHYRATPEAVLFLDWDLNLLYASQDAMAVCAGWNLGPDEARRYTAQAVFSVPGAIVSACEAMKPAWLKQIESSSDAEPPPLAGSALAPGPGYGAAITLRREHGSSLTKPIFVVRLRSPESLLLDQGANDQNQDRRRARLTPAERGLADLVCSGLSNKEIAARLQRSEGSIKVQLSGIFQKLRVHSRAKLMVALRG